MSVLIRDIQSHDLDHVLALNNNAGDSILPLDATRLRLFFDHAAYFRVAIIDEHIAGFLIALCPGLDYASPNYRFFQATFDNFVYIDRIVVAQAYRRHGLGRIFYADVQGFAEVRAPKLCCEIFLEPRDDASVLFHGSYGFREVGQQVVGNDRRVGLLAKELCSWPYVRDTYDRLPDLPWLSERATRAPLARAAND